MITRFATASQVLLLISSTLTIKKIDKKALKVTNKTIVDKTLRVNKIFKRARIAILVLSLFKFFI